MLDESLLHRRLISESEINGSEIDSNIIEKESKNNDDSNISHGSINNSPNSRLGNTNSPARVALTTICDYSPQSIYTNHNSAESQLHQDSMDQDERDRSVDLSSNNTNNTRSSNNSDVIKCPRCTFRTTVRTIFVQHVAGHYRSKATASEIIEAVFKLRSSPKESDNVSFAPEEHLEQVEIEETDEPGIRVPRLNSQGKLKTFPCKKCSFIANTKVEFWEHSRVHIKAEKLLNCPKCTFVTEYKHHLEYHLRNHAGSKPFKCTECKYSCVNKSMLNSHMKSHSNVYQYRCSNCPYATKYCHSLKLHLRKYGHTPAVVLNPDGTPNEGYIYIDIYGTKRGPKQKSKAYTKTHNDADQNINMPNNNNNNNDNVQPDLIEVPQQTSNALQLAAPTISEISDVNHILTKNDTNQDRSVYSQLLAAFDLSNKLLFCEKKTEISGETQTVKRESRVSQESEPERSQSANNDLDTIDPATSDDPTVTDGRTNVTEPFTMFVTPNSSPRSREAKDDEDQSAPLDLTVRWSDTSRGESTENLPKLSGTRRRKGIAIKLQQRLSQESDTTRAAYDEEKLSDSSTAGPSDVHEDGSINDTKLSAGYFYCAHCEITFRSEFMYTVHMGYHVDKDPFTCNMCGEKCSDSASFFFHISLCLFLRVFRANDIQNRVEWAISGQQQIFHSGH